MNEPLSTREFNKKLQQLVQSMKDIDRVEDALRSLSKGESLRFEQPLPNGESRVVPISHRNVNNFKTSLYHVIWDLRKCYGKALLYRKRLKPVVGHNGRWIVKIQPEALSLFLSVPGMLDASQVPLLRDEGLLLNTAMMSLASLYSRNQKMYYKLPGTELTRLKASAHMRESLKAYETTLLEAGWMPDDFPFTRWATIFSVIRIKTTITERKKTLLDQKEQLTQEADYIRLLNSTRNLN